MSKTAEPPSEIEDTSEVASSSYYAMASDYEISEIENNEKTYRRRDILKVLDNCSYPNGKTIRQSKTRRAFICANDCFLNENCLSWYFVKKTQKCVLNEDVPDKVDENNDVIYCGSASVSD